MSMIEEKRERFNMLIRRAELPPEIVKHELEQAYIEKVEVKRHSKTWIFHLHFPTMLSRATYRQLTKRIKDSLHHVADVDFVIRYENKVHTDRLVEEYWDDLVRHIRNVSTYAANLLEKAERKVEDDRLILYFNAPTATEMARTKKVNELVARYFQYIAGQPIVVQFDVDDTSADFQQRYEEQKLEEEQSLIEAALKQRETAKEDRAEAKVINKVVLGYEIKEEPVPIQTITEEERRIAVQGEVFRVEQRELRSGRTLLTFNLTDYPRRRAASGARVHRQDGLPPQHRCSAVVRRGDPAAHPREGARRALPRGRAEAAPAP